MLLFRFADPFEKTVQRYFSSVRSTMLAQTIHTKLLSLMQTNLIVVNIWMEYQYKGYRALRKTHRRQLYRNANLITQTFDQFVKQYPASLSKLQYMQAIMDFLKPGERYVYRNQSSFDKLLCDITKEQLRGDCNQIVTLYAYLYSRAFPLSDLQIKLLPNHICLHLNDMDIEATNATWQHYTTYDYIAPITELLAVNLLDVTDVAETTNTISPKQLAQAAKLAYHLSSNRQIVEHNLQVAYQQLAIAFEQKHNYTSAIFYAKQVRDGAVLRTLIYNAAVYYLKLQKIDTALYYAKQVNNPQLFTAIYTQQYNNIQKTIPTTLRTVQQHKKYLAKYKKLLQLAQKAKLVEQEKQLQSLLAALR